MQDRPLTTLVEKYLADNKGFVLEEDVIDAIGLLALFGDDTHRRGECTETNPSADRYCGARSLVEHAIAKIHK